MEPNWQSLLTTVGVWSQSKGWRDKPRSYETQVVNFHGELSEAWEEHRSRRYETWFSGDLAQLPEAASPMKPEGLYVELADLVIRIADTLDFENSREELPVIQNGVYPQFDKFCNSVHRMLSNAGLWLGDSMLEYTTTQDKQIAFSFLREAAAMCFYYASVNGKDLWDSIVLKHEYNTTRPYRHGNKAA